MASSGSAEPDYDSGITFNNSNQDEGVGTLRESDLQAGTINHMLRINVPDDMLKSVTSSPTQLAANAWPQTEEDHFGPTIYTGTVPYGITMGIPANAVEPANVKANAGANMLWQELRNHGAMIRDSGGSGNNVAFQTDQNVNPSDPLIDTMEQFGSEIMAQVQILANQGPNSINGGGTPIVPLDPPLSDAPGGSATSATVEQSQVSAAAASGTSMGLLKGSVAAASPVEQRANLCRARRRTGGRNFHEQHPGHGGQAGPHHGTGGDQLGRIGLYFAQLPDSDRLGTGGDTINLSHLRRSARGDRDHRWGEHREPEQPAGQLDYLIGHLHEGPLLEPGASPALSF